MWRFPGRRSPTKITREQLDQWTNKRAVGQIDTFLAGLSPSVVAPELTVTARPLSPTSTSYGLRIRNESGTALLDVSLDLSEALSPGDFGLDDTHMQRARDRPIQIACMAPATEFSAILVRSHPFSRFIGIPTKKLSAQFVRAGEGEAIEERKKLIYFSVHA